MNRSSSIKKSFREKIKKEVESHMKSAPKLSIYKKKKIKDLLKKQNEK